MKKVLLIFAFTFIVISLNAQSDKSFVRKTQSVLAPDGSVAMTITDDEKEDTLKLKSENNFYRFQFLDTETNETVYTFSNRGKICTIDKSKIAAGNYNLRLFTRNFIITSKISISTPTWNEESNNEVVAINN